MIGVFGATGKIGSQVARALQAKGVPFKCIVRDPRAAAKKLGEGVVLEQGDLSDPDGLKSALQGVDRLFLICGLHSNLAELEANAVSAAKQAGVSTIVKCSAVEPMISADSPTDIGRQHVPAERTVKESGLNWTILRPTFLMQNSLSQKERVANESRLEMPVRPDVDISFVDARDVGACAAAVLTGDEHNAKTYTLTGRRMTLGEAVDTFSSTLGRKIDYVFVPVETAISNMEKQNIPDFMRQHFLGLGRLLSEGKVTELTDDVRRLTGREPHDYASYVADNADVFGGSGRAAE